MPWYLEHLEFRQSCLSKESSRLRFVTGLLVLAMMTSFYAMTIWATIKAPSKAAGGNGWQLCLIYTSATDSGEAVSMNHDEQMHVCFTWRSCVCGLVVLAAALWAQ